MSKILHFVTPLFDSKDRLYDEAEFYVFTVNGVPRWMISTDECCPVHLKTWSTTTLKAKLTKLFLHVLWYIRLPLLSKKIVVRIHEGSIYKKIQKNYENIGIFIGTPGLNRKIILYCNNKGSGWFIKVPCNLNSSELIANEISSFKKLSQHPKTKNLMPNFKLFEGMLVTQDVAGRFMNFTTTLADASFVDTSLYEMNNKKVCITELGLLKNALDLDHCKFQRPELAALIKTVKLYLTRLIIQNRTVCVYDAHGDLTKWNLFKYRDKSIKVIDWEMYGEKTKYFDLIHYAISDEILINRTPIESMLNILWDKLNHYIQFADFEFYVGLYLVQQSLYYAVKYEDQESLHAQAFWQITAWDYLIRELSIKE